MKFWSLVSEISPNVEARLKEKKSSRIAFVWNILRDFCSLNYSWISNSYFIVFRSFRVKYFYWKSVCRKIWEYSIILNLILNSVSIEQTTKSSSTSTYSICTDNKTQIASCAWIWQLSIPLFGALVSKWKRQVILKPGWRIILTDDCSEIYCRLLLVQIGFDWWLWLPCVLFWGIESWICFTQTLGIHLQITFPVAQTHNNLWKCFGEMIELYYLFSAPSLLPSVVLFISELRLFIADGSLWQGERRC